jgi:hypothetical protein
MALRSPLFHANAKLPWLRSRSQDKRRPVDELGVMAGRHGCWMLDPTFIER